MNIICRSCRSFIRERHLAHTGFLTLSLCFSVALADPGGVADTAAGTYTLDKDTAYTITSEDVSAAGLAAQPLTLSDATLSFGDDAKVSIPVPSPVTAVRVANAPAGSAIVGVPSVTPEMKDAFWKCELVDAGESVVALDILPIIGLRMIIR